MSAPERSGFEGGSYDAGQKGRECSNLLPIFTVKNLKNTGGGGLSCRQLGIGVAAAAYVYTVHHVAAYVYTVHHVAAYVYTVHHVAASTEKQRSRCSGVAIERSYCPRDARQITCTHLFTSTDCNAKSNHPGARVKILGAMHMLMSS